MLVRDQRVAAGLPVVARDPPKALDDVWVLHVLEDLDLLNARLPRGAIHHVEYLYLRVARRVSRC